MARTSAGYAGLMEDGNLWTALLPVALMFGTSLLNLVVLGPATTKVMRERKHQGEFAQSPDYSLSGDGCRASMSLWQAEC